MLIFKHNIYLITLGCRPHITSFCDLWVKCVTSKHVTHKAEIAIWAAPDVLNQIGAFSDRRFNPKIRNLRLFFTSPDYMHGARRFGKAVILNHLHRSDINHSQV